MDKRYGTELLGANLKAGIVRVLVIDDDSDICTGLKDILQDAGYHVETASSAADGRECFDQQTYSILVVDYSLPDANGVEIAQMVHAQYPWVQTILMTGHDRVEISKNHENSPLLGAFLRKPIDVQTILEVMEQLLHRQCDHFKIARFSPQPETIAPLTPASLVNKTSASVEVMSSSHPRAIIFPIVFLIFLIGLAAGWLSHDAIKRRYIVVRSHLPMPVSNVVAAAAPIKILVTAPPVPVVVSTSLPVAPAVTQIPIAAPAKKAPEPPVVDWNSLLDIVVDPESDPGVVKASKETLVHLGKKVVPALIERLDDPQGRNEIVEMLGAIGPAALEAIPALAALENDPEVGIAALKANALIQTH